MLAEQKKNSLQVEIKMITADSSKSPHEIDAMKRLERKVGFLNMEL
jgi:hypothetical protein